MMYDGLTDAFSGQAMGLTAENVAEKYHVTREARSIFCTFTIKSSSSTSRRDIR